MLSAIVATSSRRGVLAFRSAPRVSGCAATYRVRNRVHRAPSILPTNTARCQSTKLYSHEHEEDYNSMTVADLRELLRERGLAVSGIKAQLVERLESGEIDAANVGNKPMQKREKKDRTKKKQRHREEVSLVDDEVDDNIVGSDLEGLVEQLKSLEQNLEKEGISLPEEKIGERSIHGQSQGASNLVFAKEDGDEDSDDEWYDDEDDEEEKYDPNRTVGVPKDRGQSRRGGGAATFREDFQGTRVFVQGLPEEATWQDVRHNCISSSTRNVPLIYQPLPFHFAALTAERPLSTEHRC